MIPLITFIDNPSEGVLVINLLSEIRREARKQRTNELTIEILRKWCEFDNPRPLNENFEVPSDFQFFNKLVQDNINYKHFIPEQ